MRAVPILGALVAALAFAPAASADTPQVFAQAATPIPCTEETTGATTGQRFCTRGTAPYFVSPVASFDGTPIDVSVTLPPAPAGEPDGDYPVVGVFHGYGGQKFLPSSSAVQRWVTQGYAVVSVTDRGFWGSCGVLLGPTKPPSCAKGYIHLMSNAYEVHDAQHLLGLLADQGVIDPQRIGASGGSYGGGLSLQLGALKDRVQQTDGTLVPWKSPNGLDLSIAATAPEYGWSDLQASLQPNGSTLDYAAENPYAGPDGDRRFGVNKYLFSNQLYVGGQQAGYYAPTSGAGFPDPTSNVTAWRDFNNTGGPYDGQPLANEQTAEFPNHGAYYTNDDAPPAPALLSNGWNDDLFPVSEAVRYYNRIRTDHPDAPIKMFHLNFGHSPRGGDTVPTDALRLFAAEDAWFAHYVKGQGAEPADARGGVDVLTTACNGTTVAAGTPYSAATWASLAPGEIRVDGTATQTVSPDSAPAAPFQDPGSTQAPVRAPTNACADGPDADTTGAAVYETDAAPAGGFTLAGSPTVVADLTVTQANDALVGRLYDVDPGAGTEKLIARGVYRPTGVGEGPTRQVLQLFPQAYRVAAGHTVKLELLGQDQPYMLKSTGQAPIDVANLQLRLPTIEAPGTLGGLVRAPAAKVLPSGYRLAGDVTQPSGPLPDDNALTPKPPVVAPPPTARPGPAAPAADPVAWRTVLQALRTAPRNVRLKSNRTTLTFLDRVPEAGRITYGLSVSLRKGGSRKTYAIGRVSREITRAGSFKVTVAIGARGRTILRNHPRSTITLRSYFVTAVEHRHLNAVRRLAR